MTFADGWLCRSCWKPNRARDERCYRCKTARDADVATVEARREVRTKEQARSERVPGIVAVLPATVFAWYGRLTLLGGVLLLLITPLVLINPRNFGFPVLIWVGLAASVLLVGLGMRWASGGMRASNPWAFALALVLSVALVAFSLLAMSALAPGTGNPTWMRYVSITLFGLSAILAMVGLLYSLTRDDQDDRPRQEA